MMKNYEKSFALRRVIMSLLSLFGAIVLVYDRFCADPAQKEAVLASFRDSMCVGLTVAALFYLWQDIKLRRNPEKMKERYLAENDERQIAIRSKAGMPVLLYLSVAILMAATIASYWSVTVAETLLVTSMAQLLIGCLLKVYYIKTM